MYLLVNITDAGDPSHAFSIEYLKLDVYRPSDVAVSGSGSGAIGFIMLSLILVPVTLLLVWRKRR
jgi:hypothetical protein